MTKREELQNVIIEGIEKIKTFNDTQRLEVHKIYSDIYSKYKQLPREEFVNDFSYNQHLGFIKAGREVHESEIKNLLNENYTVDVKDNFFQIKMSLRGMMTLTP